MSVPASSPPVSSLLGQPLTVEALQGHLGGLLRERETLRAGGGRDELERNRCEIAAAQRQLAVALVAAHSAAA